MELTKIELVLIHLIKNRLINQKVAGDKYNCWRLSSTISDLRKSGLEIETQNTKGEPCNYHLISHKAAITLAKNYTSQRIQHYKRHRQ